jgi:glycosyltransferase involved in cell wall biosynthesis
MAWSIRNIFVSTNPDIIHIQANGHRWFSFIYYSLVKKPVIINTIHDPYPHLGDQLSNQPRVKFAKKQARRFTKRYIVHGEKQKVDLVCHYGLNSNNPVDVIPHGHFGIYKKFQHSHFSESKNTVLFFGRIWQYKGLDVLIEAANMIHRSGKKIHFLIAGKGENIDQYLNQIEFPWLFEIKNYRVPVEEIGELFERASAVILPYKDASQSGIIPIAFAYSKPVIASRVGSLDEVVSDMTDGILIEPNNPSQLAKAIITLMEDEKLRRKMKLMTEKKITDLLSWDNVAEKTIDCYAKALI